MTIRRNASTAVTLLGALAVTSQSHANPTLRVQVDQHGDFVLFGNTLGWDCATGGTPAIPAPAAPSSPAPTGPTPSPARPSPNVQRHSAPAGASALNRTRVY